MGIEIERKFLVVSDSWRHAVESQAHILQGYLAVNPNATVRVRVKGAQAFITIKGRSSGIGRAEFEYPIPVEDGVEMLHDLAAGPIIEKDRFRVRCGAHVWDLDVFEGDNAGLVMAEVELAAADEPFERPDWAGAEVSADHRYYNSYLSQHPFRAW